MSFPFAQQQARNVFGNLSVAQRNQLTDPFANAGQGVSGLSGIFPKLPVAQQQGFLAGFEQRLPELDTFDPQQKWSVRGETNEFGTPTSKLDIRALGQQGSAFGQAPPQGFGPQQQMGTGQMASLGGTWANVDRWDSVVQQKANQYGVPANLVKAIMQFESNGDPNAMSPVNWDGTRAVGLMQIHLGTWGNGPWATDPVANIDKGIQILADNYRQYGSWEMAAKAYLGFGTDVLGTNPDSYWARVNANWQELNSAGGLSSMAGNQAFMQGFTGGGQGAISGIFPSGSVHDWGEFNAPSSNGFYGYGTAYGLNGSNHTGLDVAMPTNSPMYAPMGGTVTCAGTGNGPGADGGGCAAFGDYFGSGAGRVEIQLDNGAVLIYGHSSQAVVRPGQRVNPGQLLGYSGGMVSPHIHLEARVRDSSTSSGWRIVDPRSVLGGGGFSPAPGGYTPAQQQGGGYGMSPQQRLIAMLRGGF